MKNSTKILIFICCAIIGLVYFNYPVQSKNLSFFIVFICLAVIVLTIVKLTNKDETPTTYEEAEKEMDKIYEIDGIFRYVNDGFYLTRNNSMEYIKWTEIIEINQFYVSMGRGFQGGLEIVTAEKSIEINSNNSPGFAKFTLEINNNLDIDPSWTVDYTIDAQQIVKAGLFKNRIYSKNSFS
ncbi:MAG: hypothetical protein K0M56_07695 [Kaistella sp.]|nr:hypothetical protein [Kaistella sp.]